MEVYAITGGTVHNINDGNPFKVVAFDNLGDSPLHRLTERGPQQHGETDLGLRLDPRTFPLIFLINATGESDWWDKRKTLSRILAPHVGSMSIKFVLDNGDKRQIDCFPVESPRPADASEVYLLSRVAARFRAPDPTFYDPEGKAVIFALGGGATSGFTVPMPVPFKVGLSELDQVHTIAYTGTWYGSPIIKAVGPVTNLVITNQTTGEKLDFTGVTINAGDYYEIDTRYHQKTVKDSNGTSKLSDLTTDSNLSTFHLEHDDRGTGTKNNDIRVTGSNINADTEIYFQYKLRYTGV